MAYLNQTLGGYNKNAYVPGGSSKAKASAIQKKGYATGKVIPVKKPSNPYRPQSQTGANSASLAQALGVGRQQASIQRAAPSLNFDPISYESDPVLARIKALGQQNVSNAQTEADALRKQAITESGFGNVGAEIGLDQGTVQAANANPFSTRAQIEKTGQDKSKALDESLNQSNLFFSGHRAEQMGELARNQAQAQTDATTGLRSLLGNINSGVLSAQQLAIEQEQMAAAEAAQMAQQEAFNRAQQEALAALLAPPIQEVLPATSAAPYYAPDPYNDLGQTAYEAALVGGQSPYVPEMWYEPPAAYNPPVDDYQYPYYYGGQAGSVYAE